ncbi:tRNA dihydrouridine synthase [Thiopseudomonas acetoxidans]|uniref:tRNA-dihydrouridine(16) synthase n=1 Tax=Thiopseudomonas acetoxidans TaxID=3041622 RepID=A0ABT7SMD8_9GAMM|nr:tRNA-dihydrouridine synthase [Thiopseudomonas sp. CY1220]MDM7857346.1 tRNA-dihydrouridine synthase [Thiopseudomonas sp. CY1220]
MEIALAPMEGLADAMMRDLLTRQGGIDWCVTEFIRITDTLLPPSIIQRIAPELKQGSATASGTQLRVQLLGSDPVCLAENAAQVAQLGASVVDLNFGCPAKTVNKSKGGAILMKEPERLFRIAEQVRVALPKHTPLTAKMRLGYDNTDTALDCARALAQGGIAQLVVHARTKTDGYKPPAHWEWIAKIQDVVDVPVMANGEVWSVADWLRCREVSGVQSVMIGRGLVTQPDLARQIQALQRGESYQPLTWEGLMPLIQEFWQRVRINVTPRQAPGRLKQWLALLMRNYPEAQQLFNQIRRETDANVLDVLLLGNTAQT